MRKCNENAMFVRLFRIPTRVTARRSNLEKGGLNCRILDSRLIYHDEDTLTGSECVVGEDTVTVSKTQ